MRYATLATWATLWISIFFISACSHQGSLESFNKHYYGGEDKKAYEYAKKEAGSSGDVLWNLQAGISGFSSQQQDTAAILEQGELLFSQYEAEGLLGGIFGNVGAVILNENVKTYRGNIYEGVMFNYYKALNAMSQGDYALARVEFNRANDRQRRAKDYFNKDIQKAMVEESKQSAQDKTLNQVDMSASTQAISPILEQQYSNLKNFHAYGGFINPAVSYVSALFFMSEGDYSKALDLYKESYGINKAQVINQDLQVMQNRKTGKLAQKYTWIIIEDGKSAYKQDMSLDLPAYLVSSNVLHVGVSVPTIIAGVTSARAYYALNASSKIEANEISLLDAVIANEFEKQLPFILTRAITSAILKASTQAVLSDQLGTAGALAGMLYSIGTTSADVRIATALPNRILAMQIPNNAGDVSLQADGYGLYNVHFECINDPLLQEKAQKLRNVVVLCEKHDNILYLRVKGSNPTYRILKGGMSE